MFYEYKKASKLLEQKPQDMLCANQAALALKGKEHLDALRQKSFRKKQKEVSEASNRTTSWNCSFTFRYRASPVRWPRSRQCENPQNVTRVIKQHVYTKPNISHLYELWSTRGKISVYLKPHMRIIKCYLLAHRSCLLFLARKWSIFKANRRPSILHV